MQHDGNVGGGQYLTGLLGFTRKKNLKRWGCASRRAVLWLTAYGKGKRNLGKPCRIERWHKRKIRGKWLFQNYGV